MTPGNVEVEALPEAISLPPGFGLTVTESAKSPLWLWQRFLVGRLVKLQAPNPKLQTSSKLQIPEASRAARPACHRRNLVQHEGPVVLELGACNFFGIWSFVRSRSPPSTRLHQPKRRLRRLRRRIPRRSRANSRRTRFMVPMHAQKRKEVLHDLNAA